MTNPIARQNGTYINTITGKPLSPRYGLRLYKFYQHNEFNGSFSMSRGHKDETKPKPVYKPNGRVQKTQNWIIWSRDTLRQIGVYV